MHGCYFLLLVLLDPCDAKWSLPWPHGEQLRTAGCRALAEEDEAANGQGGPIEETVGPSGQELYQRGSFASSPHKTMPAYLTRSAGMFMDVAEGLVNNHLRNEDLYSGLITSEWYALAAICWW